MWEVLCILSFLINIFLALYIRWLLKYVTSNAEDVKSLSIMITSFSNHISKIYELEMFYGDETLKSLMQHAKEVIESIEEMDLIIEDDETDTEKIV